MRVIPVAVTVGVVAASGLMWFGYPQPQSARATDGEAAVSCDIVYADGSGYGYELSQIALERIPMEIRRVAVGRCGSEGVRCGDLTRI